MRIPDPTHPEFKRIGWYSLEMADRILKSHPQVALKCNQQGFVFEYIFQKIFEDVTRLKLIDELKTKIFEDKRFQVISVPTNTGSKQCVRVTYGHTGPVIEAMLKFTHTPYFGPQFIFCFTHTSMDGLGVLNSGRCVNMLVAPEFCQNKGVKAYVDIRKLALNGILVWRQNGDRHQARVFCFDTDMKSHAHRYEYSDDYLKDENLLRVHSGLVNTLKQFHTGIDSEKKILSQIRKLIISDDDDDSGITEELEKMEL